MISSGWISLYRSVRDHWIWTHDKTFDYAHAWIDLLLDVNHEERKVIIEGRPVIIGRGQKWTSIRTLAERWGWSRNKVQRFLSVLQADGMLNLERTENGTLLTVVKYDDFQVQRDTKGTLKGQQRDTKGTLKGRNNNDNNDNNIINKSIPFRTVQNFKHSDTDYDDLAYQIMKHDS